MGRMCGDCVCGDDRDTVWGGCVGTVCVGMIGILCGWRVCGDQTNNSPVPQDDHPRP